MRLLSFATGITVLLLNGCAVYEPAYTSVPYYYQSAPVYAQPVYPQPVYVTPAPIYVRPPVTFDFSFGYWSGGGHGWHGHGGGGDHGGGWHHRH